jgi:hypothetical protein
MAPQNPGGPSNDCKEGKGEGWGGGALTNDPASVGPTRTESSRCIPGLLPANKLLDVDPKGVYSDWEFAVNVDDSEGDVNERVLNDGLLNIGE